MTYYCNLCDKSIKEKSKCNHLKSIDYEILDESIIRRFIFRKPNVNDIDGILRKYITIYNKKYQQYSVSCEINLLTTTNRIRHIRINEKLDLEYFLKFFLKFDVVE